MDKYLNKTKSSIYGNMTKDEIDLVYNFMGNYKGWTCVEIGCGLLVMEKDGIKIRAYRGIEIQPWIPECWYELKEKIDSIEEQI